VFPSETHFVGINSSLAGTIANVEDLYISHGTTVLVYSTSNTAQLQNGTFFDITVYSNLSYPYLTVKQGGTMEFSRIADNLTITSTDIYVRYGALMICNEIEVDTTFFSVESEGVLATPGRGFKPGFGPGSATGNKGPSYGGFGGGHDLDAAAAHPYGSVYEPLTLGSGAGSTGSEVMMNCYESSAVEHHVVECQRGSGGGRIVVNAGKEIEIDGLLLANGAPGASGQGGGTGGSVDFETTNFTGHGEVNVNGGSGGATAYGGSGGRVAVHARFLFAFGGQLRSVGGESPAASSGGAGPGTVYAFESNRGPQYSAFKYDPDLEDILLVSPHRRVILDNENNDVTNPGMIMDVTSEFLDFDELTLNGHARLWFYHPSNQDEVTLVVHKMLGDRTGLVRIRDRQRMFVEVVAAAENEHDVVATFHVNQGAELLMPTKLILRGEDIVMEGRLTNVEDIHIQRGGEFACKVDCQTALLDFVKSNTTKIINGIEYEVIETASSFYPENSYAELMPIRSMRLNELEVMKDGLLSLHADNVFIEAVDFDIRYGGRVQSETLNVSFAIGAAYVEHTAVFSASLRGRAPVSGGSTYSAGGSFGNRGGNGISGSAASPVGSIYQPSFGAPGYGGGHASGGAGGGGITILAGGRFFVDGSIETDGGSSSIAGGGSGGGLYLSALQLDGHGLLSANGGSAGSCAGGGSGGRITIIINEGNYTWHGTARALGGGRGNNNGNCDGSSGDPDSHKHGGAGSVYIDYSPSGAVRFDRLELDNVGRPLTQSWPYILDEGPVTFDTVHLVRGIYFQLSSASTPVYTHHVTGDVTGVVHIQAGRNFSVGGKRYETSSPEANFDIDASGFVEAVYRTYILGTVNLGGALSGVAHLVLMPTARFNVNGGSTRCTRSNVCSANDLGKSSNKLFAWVLHAYDGAILSTAGNRVDLRDPTLAAMINVDDLHLQGTADISAEGVAIWIRHGRFDKRTTIAADGQGYTSYDGPTDQAGSVWWGSHHKTFGGSRSTSSCSGGGSRGTNTSFPDVCAPLVAGGGKSANTAGGGVVQVVGGIRSELEGLVTVNGVSRGCSGVGAGAGGSIHAEGVYVEGHGILRATGGALTGCSRNCAGAGAGAGGVIAAISHHTINLDFNFYDQIAGGSGAANGIFCSASVCSDHGSLVNGVCQCDAGYTGHTCSYKQEGCGVNGHMGMDGKCVCNTGWVGYACEYECDASTTCNDNGHCSPLGECVCDACASGEFCETVCSGNGTCVADQCRCNPCYHGPLCGSQCSSRGNCTNDACDCEEKFIGEFCAVAACPGPNGRCSDRGTCNSFLHECKSRSVHYRMSLVTRAELV
jgi:hypothetical protein